MERQRDATSEGFVWVGVEGGLAIRFNKAGQVDGLVAAGVITTDRLRAIHTTRWEHIDPHATTFPTWRQVEVPDLLDVELAHVVPAAREAAIDECLDYEEETGLPHPDVIEDLKQSVADGFDNVDDFYKALAGAIQRVAPFTFSINKAIAAGLDITPNTAGQYVSRCRKRGYLPPSRRSKA